MRFNRDLKIHKCNACAKPLDDDDFVALGLNIRTRLQLFFDYVCPKCAHHGRYNLDLEAGTKIERAFEILAAQVEEEAALPDSGIDWDSIKWE